MLTRKALPLISLIILALVAYGFYMVTSHVPSNGRILERQKLPPVSALELPPQAPIPSVPFEFPKSSARELEATPVKTPSASAPKPQARAKKEPRPPTQWEIVNQFRQVIRLDVKDLQIAVTSDRYGYHNQAIIYYKRYLTIAPSSPYADQVRSRLAQLESGG